MENLPQAWKKFEKIYIIRSFLHGLLITHGVVKKWLPMSGQKGISTNGQLS